VGWCCGRFNEVYSQITGYKGIKYNLNCNAEYFYIKAQKLGLKVQEKPTLGGIMVWEGKGKLAGHVASVEQELGNDTYLTSESGWKHFSFKNFTRTKGSNGNYGVDAKNYKYLGCIINPANPKPEPTPSEYPFDGLIKKGCKLYTINGTQYKNSNRKDRIVQVQGEANGRYKIYCKDFSPTIVYVNKNDVTKQSKIYPFNATIKKGAKLYNANGKAYANPNRIDRVVRVDGELNGRYQIYSKAYSPNIVYCDKSSIKK
jgi:surface antigen